MGTIVVAVDGSDGSREALRFAVEEARFRNATLRVVTAWSVPALAYGGGYAVVGIDPEPYGDAATAVSEQALASIAEETAGIDIKRVVREGQAAEVVIDEARGADMVIVGSRGHGGFANLLLGSVSHQIAHHAPCTVVIVNRPHAGDVR
jgi:nucleotide-binding universal stress UspA family protein